MFSKLRHPIRSITEPYGKAGLIVAILALVLATTGAAFAAAGLNSKQKKEVTKIAKKYAGKPGAPGATGAAGTNGTNGKDGTNGAPGANGKSVALGSATAGECPQSKPAGGVTVEVEGSAGTKKPICNGKEGSPWTAGGTLPSEKTETGAWAFGPSTEPPNNVERLAIPFPIPLESALDKEHVRFVNTAKEEFNTATHVFETPQNCLGSIEAPAANPGFLCVYVGVAEHQGILLFGIVPPASAAKNPIEAIAGELQGAGVAGAVLLFQTAAGSFQEALANGTWAVTAG